jgi:hypothetical protein
MILVVNSACATVESIWRGSEAPSKLSQRTVQVPATQSDQRRLHSFHRKKSHVGYLLAAKPGSLDAQILADGSIPTAHRQRLFLLNPRGLKKC